MLRNSVVKNAWQFGNEKCLANSSIEYEKSTKEDLLGTLQGTLLGALLGTLWDPRSLRTWAEARPNVHSVLAGERCMPMQRWDADPFLTPSQEAMDVSKGRFGRPPPLMLPMTVRLYNSQ